MCTRCREMPREAVPAGAIGRRDFLRLGGAGLAGVILLGGAGSRVLAQTGSSLKAEFESAAMEYGVPQELLLAMGYVNTLWEMPPPEASDYEEGDLHGRGAYGIMQLIEEPVGDSLSRASALTRLSEDKLKSDRAANILGGAAVLAEIQGPDRPAELNGWQGAVSAYGGIDLYAEEVYETLQSGASATISTGESLELPPQAVEVPRTFSPEARGYRRAIWRPAHRRNYSNRNRGPKNIDLVVIHIAEGSYSGTISWFKKQRAKASAHYVVGGKGKVAQCVRDEDIAWHAGNWTYNRRSIGIEHAGFASDRDAWEGKYPTSAKLSAFLSRRYGIPVDRDHFVLHRNVPGVTKSCPGPHFDYDRYVRLVKAHK
jgi:N-acetylmuramoyl-L-alanine amidase